MSTLVEVPHCDEMDYETVVKHLNARHLNDMGLSKVEHSPLHSIGLQETLRSYHNRCHAIAVPGQHNHYHEESA